MKGKRGHKGLRKIGLMQLSVVRTLQCLVKGEALVSLCPGHAAIPLPSRLHHWSSDLGAAGILKYGIKDMTGCLTSICGCDLTWQAPLIWTRRPCGVRPINIWLLTAWQCDNAGLGRAAVAYNRDCSAAERCHKKGFAPVKWGKHLMWHLVACARLLPLAGSTGEFASSGPCRCCG